MTRSPRLLLIAAAWLLAATSLLCSISGTGDIDPDDPPLEEELEERAFETSNAQFTQTAEAADGSAATRTPTATRPAATEQPSATAPDPLDLLSEHSDPTGDTVNCLTNNPAPDEGSDIVNVKIVEAPDSDHEGFFAIIELAKAISEFLDIDFSFAISISAFLHNGDLTSFLFERHDGVDRIGQEDASHQVIPDTEHTISQTPDGSSVMVQLPVGTTKFDVYSFHTPSKDAPDDYFCDRLTGITVPNGN